MTKKAELHYNGKIYELPIITGTENENAIDISRLRADTGLITLDKGFKIFIISGGTNKGVKERLKDLGIEEIFLGEHTKKDTYDKLIKKYNLKKNEIVYMGDDIPDIPVMKKIGVPCCPNDAVPDVKQMSIYVSKKNGGQGCVRDIIEQTLRVQNKWLT